MCHKDQVKSKLAYCDKTLILSKLKRWQNSNFDKTQIATKLKNLNCEENSIGKNIMIVDHNMNMATHQSFIIVYLSD